MSIKDSVGGRIDGKIKRTMPIWLTYPQWIEGRTRLAVNPFVSIHKAHVYDIETINCLEKLGMSPDVARLTTDFYPKYADRVLDTFFCVDFYSILATCLGSPSERCGEFPA